MTRASIREYTEAIRGRYLRASKAEKGKILDEFTKVTGYHRKAIIRLLHRVNELSTAKKRGRPRQYSATEVGALRVAWEATDRLCSKRLHPFLPELVKILRRHGNTTMTVAIEAQLCRISPSTINRLLCPWRRLGGRRPFTTLSTVDVASGWSECIGVWGKGQERVGAAVHRVRPFLLLGLDSDNGSEFINQHLYPSIEGLPTGGGYLYPPSFLQEKSFQEGLPCGAEELVSGETAGRLRPV